MFIVDIFLQLKLFRSGNTFTQLPVWRAPARLVVFGFLLEQIESLKKILTKYEVLC